VQETPKQMFAQIARVPFQDAEYRLYFKTEKAFREAMEKARQLERRNCPARAWRVRLNLDNTF
jgi:hypothetical protein